MASSELGDSLKVASRKLRNKFLEEIAEVIYREASSSKNGKVPWGFSAKILKESREQEPWVTKNTVSFVYKKYCKKKLLEDTKATSDNNPNLCMDMAETNDKVKEIRGLTENMEIPLSTIRNHRNAIFLTNHECSSLMTPVEPHLVTLICAMAQIRRCLRASSECIGLANDLIKGMPLWKKK